MKEITCKVCGSLKVISATEFKGYFYCQDCDLMWKKVFPKTKYKKEYFTPKSSFVSRLFAPIANMLYKLRQKYISVSRSKLWVDVGAGEGNFLLSVPFERRVGVEVSAVGRNMMSKNGLETMTNDQFLKTTGLKADVISFWHVLEHLEEPWVYLKAAKNNLAKSGIVVVGVPNIASWEFKFFREYWFHLAPEYHLWHFSENSMIKMIQNSGLQFKYISYWTPEHTIAGLLQSAINISSKTDAVLHKLVKRELGNEELPLKGILWSIFWLTLGLPVILVVWLIEAVFRRSGAIVIVATYK